MNRLLLALLATFAAQTAAAATCTHSVGALAFGKYAAGSRSHLDSTSLVTVTCSGALRESVSYSISFSRGSGSSFSPRTMRGGPGLLGYSLYRDPARTQIWGDGTSATFTVSDAYTLGTPTMQRTYVVYGRVLASQQARVGSYSDTLVVTLSF